MAIKKLICSIFCISVVISTSAATPQPSGLVAVKLNTLWRTKIKEKNGVTADPAERDKSSVSEALYYVPAAAVDAGNNKLEGVAPLLRTAGGDSKASGLRLAREGEDTTAPGSLLGYAWTNSSAVEGLVPIVLDSNTAAGYGFPRSTELEKLVSVSGGGVTVKSNANAGGAVWEWWWKDKQFINDYDQGRQISTALYTQQGNVLEEAGDGFGGPKVPLHERHPCPTLYIRTNGETQSSRALPCDWTPSHQTGGKDNAVVYLNAKIGKELTLNYKGPDGVDRNWPVAVYQCAYEGPMYPVASVEAPTGYLTAEFTTYYRYEPAKDLLTPVKVLHSKADLSAGTAYGLILASGEGPNAIAMGIYIDDPGAGIVLYDNSGTDGGKYGSSFSKWGVVFRTQVESTWRFRTWIITDTVANIQKDFHQLHEWGVKSRDFPHK